jgi:hypothetical protein
VARSRDSTMQAGCSLQATRLVSSTRRPVGSATTPESRTPRTWPGSCGSGAPRPGWSRTRATRYTYHNERHPIGLLTICSRPLPGSAPAWVKVPRCPTHRLWGGDDGLLPRYRSSAVLGASEDISALLPQGAIAGEPGTQAPHIAVITFGGREIFPPSTCTDGASCCLPGRWRGMDLSCGACDAAAGVPLDVYRFVVKDS